MAMRKLFGAMAVAALAASLMAAVPASGPAASAPATATGKPTLYLIGDSTVNNNANGGLGWGAPFIKMFDPAKITVKNTAIAGRSARSFFSEGRWDGPTGIKTLLKPGDFVLMEMGTNDGPGSVQQIADPNGTAKGRPDLAGLGDETAQGPDSSAAKKIETVHTYGWYMRKFVVETKEKGATPVMLTMIPHDAWTGDKLRRGEINTFVKWSKQIADEEKINFIDLNDITATRLEKENEADVTTKYFTPPGDRTHTNPVGAKLNAESVVMGIRALPGLKLNDYLTDEAKCPWARAGGCQGCGVAATKGNYRLGGKGKPRENTLMMAAAAAILTPSSGSVR